MTSVRTGSFASFWGGRVLIPCLVPTSMSRRRIAARLGALEETPLRCSHFPRSIPADHSRFCANAEKNCKGRGSYYRAAFSTHLRRCAEAIQLDSIGLCFGRMESAPECPRWRFEAGRGDAEHSAGQWRDPSEPDFGHTTQHK
jgi:hypothetical protein